MKRLWMKVGQTCKTRICENFLSASNSHSRHLFVERMSGPGPLSLRFQQTSSFKTTESLPDCLGHACFDGDRVAIGLTFFCRSRQQGHHRSHQVLFFSPCKGEPGYQGNCCKHSKAFEGLKQIRIQRTSFHRFEHQCLNQNKCGAH